MNQQWISSWLLTSLSTRNLDSFEVLLGIGLCKGKREALLQGKAAHRAKEEGAGLEERKRILLQHREKEPPGKGREERREEQLGYLIRPSIG